MRTRFRAIAHSPFNTKLSHYVLLLTLLGSLVAPLACSTSGESSEPKFSAQFLGQSDYPEPGKMTYRPPRILMEPKGVRVIFDLVNGKPYSHPAVILKITLLGPSGERHDQEIYVGPMLARETKRVSALVEAVPFEPDDLTVELLTKH